MLDNDQIMTIGEVSHYLKLARSTIYRHAQKGKLPGRKIGGAWRFSRRSLDEWLAAQSTEPNAPPPEAPTIDRLPIAS
jgi:excisionase family DNA binding protein